MTGTLHRISTKVLLRALQTHEPFTLSIRLSPDQHRRLARVAATEGDTPEQAVRKLINDYCTDAVPSGRWSTGEPYKPQPRSQRVLEKT